MTTVINHAPMVWQEEAKVTAGQWSRPAGG